MIIHNLKKSVFTASGLKFDHRWTKWAKFVDSVDTSKSNGYAFIGAFVPDGSVELEEKPRLILVASETGSTKYRSYNYAVVRMDADGSLFATGIETDGTRGWALRIRDDIAALLAEMQGQAVSPLAKYSTDELMAELARRGVEVK